MAVLEKELRPDVKARLEDQRVRLRVRSSSPSWLRSLWLLWLLVGPGLLVMIGDNDAGGVITYATTGAQYGLGFFVPFLLLMIPVAYVVQEMTVRLGAVTQKGHAELIFDRFGRFWGMFSMVDLAVGNVLTLVTEFIGMEAGLSLFGVPRIVAVPACFALVAAVALSGRYWQAERTTLLFALANLVFVPLALMAHPDPAAVARSLVDWSLPGGATGSFLFLLVANIGTTVAPWMLFYQQGAVVDKGMTPRDIPQGRLDTLLGSVVMSLVAVAIVILTATTLHTHHVTLPGSGDASFAQALVPFLGTTAAKLFAIGLFEAGLVAAITIGLSSAWALGEVLGYPHSLNVSVREAPGFYGVYLGSMALAAAIVLIPHAPLELISLTVQVVATLLMPPALLFLLLLANDRELMGPYANTRAQNAATVVILTGILAASTLLGISTVFPHFTL